MPELLPPLTYQHELSVLVEAAEPGLWSWFASAAVTSDYLDGLRRDLLRSTYRLEAASHPDVYSQAQRAATNLGLELPVSVYQMEQVTQLNAGLIYVPDQLIVVLSGPIIELLDADEMAGVFGHEFAHHVLWSQADGRYLTTSRLLDGMADEPHAGRAHHESARRFDLATELYADRGSLLACDGNLSAAVSGLVKVATGLRTVDASSYLRQADEVLSEAKTSEGSTHPETYIRAKALAEWHMNPVSADAVVRTFLEGEIDVDCLDLLEQVKLTNVTRAVIDDFLTNEEMRTETTVGHAKLYFPDIESAPAEAPAQIIPAETTKRYLAHVLLDFAAVDADLDRDAFVHALRIAKTRGLDDELVPIIQKEMNLSNRDLLSLRKDAGLVIS